MPRRFERVGERFGQLVILSDTDKRTNSRGRIVLCQCDCGAVHEVALDALVGGKTVSCGCYGKNQRRIAVMNRTNKLSPEQKEQVAKLYEQGHLAKNLAEEFNIDRTSIYPLIKARGGSYHNKSYVFRKSIGHTLNEKVFDCITEEAAYWVGFLMADGAVVDTTVALALQGRDVQHLEKFKQFVGGSQKITPISTGCFRFAFQSAYVVEALARYGVTPCKSATAKAGIELIQNRHFWRGVIDGDGHLGLHQVKNRNNPTPRIELVGSFDTVKQFLEFVNQYITRTKVQICKDKSIYRVQFSCGAAKKITETLYANSTIYLDRKQTIAMKFVNTA